MPTSTHEQYSRASTDGSAAARSTSPWIVSGTYDGVYFIGSVGFSLVFYALYAASQYVFPESARYTHIITIFSLVFSGMFDHPHIWQTLTRTHLDPDERQRHRILYSYGLGLFIVAGFVIKALDWTSAFYLFLSGFGVWHIMRQNIGLMMLYRLRANQRDQPSARADKSFFYTANLLFVTYRLRHDSYFDFPAWSLDVLDILLPFTLGLFVVTTAAVVYFSVVASYRQRRIPWVKLLFMGFVSAWQGFAYVWMIAPHPIVTAAETIYHNVQYQGWILRYQKRRFPDQPTLPMKSAAWALLYGGLFCVVMVLTFYEPLASWLVWPFLMMVCFHYVVDGLIWRFKRDPWLAD